MKKYQVGVIGVGGYGKFILNDYILPMADKGDWEIVAAVVRNPAKNSEMCEKLATYNCSIFSTSKEMYDNTNLDLVIIATGIEFHLEQTVEALENGVNVFVEKPAAGTIADVEKMIEAQKKSGKWVIVGFQHISSPELWSLKKYLVAEKFGKLKNISVSGCWPRDDAYYNRNDWAGAIYGSCGTLVYDSPANNAFAHFLNYPLFLAGKEFDLSAEPVAIYSNLYRARSIETFDVCSIKVKCKNSVEIIANFAHACKTHKNPTAKLICEDATIYHYFEGFFEIFDNQGNLIEKSDKYDARKALFDGAYHKLQDNSYFACQLENALQHTRCIEMLHANADIIDVKSSDYEILENGTYAVRWIDDLFAKAFKEDKMLDEVKI